MNSQSSLTRRQFLSTAAAATAAAALPCGDFAFGQSSTPSSTPALDPDWANAGIVATRNSPYAKLKSVPVQAVTITPGFWSKRRQTNVESSIPSMRQELVAHGRMDNFLRLEGKSTAPQQRARLLRFRYLQVDWKLWGSCCSPDRCQNCAGTVTEMIRQIVAVQEPSGYLNTYFVEARQGRSHAPQDPDRLATNSTVLATCCRGASPTTAPPAIQRC